MSLTREAAAIKLGYVRRLLWRGGELGMTEGKGNVVQNINRRSGDDLGELWSIRRR
jgi:hypothetical protein